MGISSPGLALDSIRKASQWEPKEKYLPRYLSLQSELEISLGKKGKAYETLLTAKQIIDIYNDFWLSNDQKDITERINDVFENLKLETT